MKIGFFLPNATFDRPGTPEVGGIESFTFTVGEALQRLGHEVVLFGGAPKPGRTHQPTTLTLELHPYWETASIPDIGTRFQRLVQRLHFAWSSRRAWTRQRCDVVILAKPFDWPIAWFWKRARPELKVIMGFHGTDFFSGDRRFYSAVDAAFAVSRRVADLAERRIGQRPVLMPNPVDTAFFAPDDRTPDSALWQLVASGRLVGWKGFAHLLTALAEFKKRTKIPFHFRLAGDGPERPALEQQVRDLGLEHEVTLLGRLDPLALRELLRSGDLYVAPSLGLEAFSIAALEAGCVGLPLLLSDQVGLRDFLTSEDYVDYPHGSTEALVEKLIAQHKQREANSGLDRTARHARHARLREGFSAETVAARILQLVEKA